MQIVNSLGEVLKTGLTEQEAEKWLEYFISHEENCYIEEA